MKFILQRHRGLNWEFLFHIDDLFCYPTYKTKYNNTYGIFTCSDVFKPIWIGRLFDDAWLNWEHEVRPSILLAYDDNNKLMWKYSWQ